MKFTTSMIGDFISNQSIKIRFMGTLSISIARVVLSFIGGIIIARSLGPTDYGNYNFLLGSFVSIATLFNMGTFQGFYTFISQRKRGLKYWLYYLLWIGAQFIIILSLISFILPGKWYNKIWLGHAKGMVVIAFVATFITDKVWVLVEYAGESIRRSVVVQLYKIVIACSFLCAVVVMAFLHCLTIANLFVTLSLIYLLLSILLAIKLKDDMIINEDVKLLNMISEFKVFCAPLVVHDIVTFGYLFADVWLLQRFGGAVQQAFYSVGLRFSSIFMVVNTSIIAIFWKEIAEVYKLKNKERLYYLYTRISRGVCFVLAAGVCFLIPFSREILIFLLGPRYETGWFCLSLMFLYPIFLSSGEINGTFLYATERTKLFSAFKIIIMLVSIPVTYFLLANSSSVIPGLGMGSTGMAVKVLIFQIIKANLLTYFICRLSGWRFSFLYQFGIIGYLLLVSFSLKGLVNLFFYTSNISYYFLGMTSLCMPVYIMAVALLLYLFPKIGGLERKQIKNAIKFCVRSLRIL